MQRQSGRNPRNFVSELAGKRFGLVYSHRFHGSLEETWYHRWRTDVVALFSYAVESLGGVPVFFNVDQFVHHLRHENGATGLDFVINLNAGNRFLDNWALAPALARWREIPVFPCGALTVLMGEHKGVSKMVAEARGWRTPSTAHDLADADALVVEKPMTFGSSVGLSRMSLKEFRAKDTEPGMIAEAFVPGFDATVVVLYSLFLQAPVCLGAMVHAPQRDAPEDWMYDAYEKRHPNVRTLVEQRFHPIDDELASRSVALSLAFEACAVARIDVRLDRLPEPGAVVRFSECTFLEINPMPTIAPGSSVTMFAAKLVEANANDPIIEAMTSSTQDPIRRAAAYILAAGLYARSELV